MSSQDTSEAWSGWGYWGEEAGNGFFPTGKLLFILQDVTVPKFPLPWEDCLLSEGCHPVLSGNCGHASALISEVQSREGLSKVTSE